VIHFFSLLLLTMPALSVSGILGFSYFPNEKLVFLIIFSLFLGHKYKIKLSDLTVMLFITIVLTTITIVQGLENIKIANINTAYFFITIVFYIAYFKKFGPELLRILPSIVAIQLIASFFQQWLMFGGFHELVLMFNNFPPQDSYLYPYSFGGLFRTSGFFNESSQYSMFLVLYIILYIEGWICKDKLGRYVFIFSIIDLMINESITAYIIIFIYGLIKVFFSRGRIYYKIGVITSFVLLAFSFQKAFLGVVEKILGTFLMTSDSFGRLSTAIDKIIYVSNNSIFTGYGLDWKVVSHDVISVYYYGFGLFGLLVILLFLIYISIKTRNMITLIWILFLMTNAVLMVTMNIILIGFASYLGFKIYSMRIKNA
jgi:hypothetical protein